MIETSRSFVDKASMRLYMRAGVLTVAAGLAGCAQAPIQADRSSHYKEHFAEGKYYGKASPRVIADR